MRRARPTVAVIMGGVVVLALAFAAIRSGSFLVVRVVYGLTYLSLLLAVIAARYRPGRAGRFWFGFAVFGWSVVLTGFDSRESWAAVADLDMTDGDTSFQVPTLDPIIPLGQPIWDFSATLAQRFSPPDPRPPLPISGMRDEEQLAAFQADNQTEEEILVTAVGVLTLLSVLAFATVGGLCALAMGGDRNRPTDG